MPVVSISLSDAAYTALKALEKGKKRKLSEITCVAILEYAENHKEAV